MDPADEVLAAARKRAEALATADAEQLIALLHQDFVWTSHLGETFDRIEYVRRKTLGHTVWWSQTLVTPRLAVVGETAVLAAEVVDVVGGTDGEPETFRMPVTQTWVRVDGAWQCLAGHAGPRQPIDM